MADGEIRIDTRINNNKMNSDLVTTQKKISRLSDAFNKQTKLIQEQETRLSALKAEYEALTIDPRSSETLIKMNNELNDLEFKFSETSIKVENVATKLEQARIELERYSGIDPAKTEALQLNVSRLTLEFDRLFNKQEEIGASAETLEQKIAAIKLDPANSIEAQNLKRNIESTNLELTSSKNKASQLKTELNQAFRVKTKPLTTGIRKAGNETKRADTHARQAASGFEKMGNRIKAMLLTVGIFNVLRTALTHLRDYIGSLLKTNAQFVASLNTIKANLAVAFQPIFDAILPILNIFMQTLAKVTGYLAAFISLIFGKSVKQTKEAAAVTNAHTKAINGQTKATKNLGKATKKTAESVASFDEINKLSMQTAEDAAAAGGGAGGAGGVDISKAEIPELSPAILDTWNKFLEILEPTRQALARLWDALQPFKDYVAQGAIDFYNKFLVPVGNWVLGKGLPSFIDGLTSFYQNVQWGKINKALGNLWDTLAPFAINIGEGLLWFWLNVLVPLETWTMNEVVPRFLNILTSALRGLNYVIDAVKPALKYLWDEFLKPIANWTGSKIADFLDLVKLGLDGIGDWFNSNGGTITSILKSIIDILKVLWENSLKPILDFLWQGFKAFFEWFGPIMDETLGGLIEALGGILDFIAGIFTGDMERSMRGLETFINGVWESIKSIGMGIWEPIKKSALDNWEGIKLIWKIVSTWFNDNVVKPINNFFTGMWDGIKKLANDTWTGISNIWEAVSTWFNDNVIMPVNNFFTGMWDGLKKGASDAWEGIQNVFKVVGDWFKTIFTDAWEGVKNVFSTGGKIFTGIKEGIERTFKTVVNGIIGGINTIIAVPFNAINSMLNKIRSIDILGIKPFQTLWGENPLRVPQIPKLAKGGVLRKGQVGLLEGSGAEAVVPLENNTQWINKVAEKLASALNSFSLPAQIIKSIVEREERQTLNNKSLDNNALAQTIGEAVALNVQNIIGEMEVIVDIGGQQFGAAVVKWGEHERNRMGTQISNRTVTV